MNRYDHLPHYTFQLYHTIPGLFAGPCGFHIGAYDWSYHFELSGDHSEYSGTAIDLSDEDHKKIEIVSGQVHLDQEHKKVTINLTVNMKGHSMSFPGNGTFNYKRNE